MLTDLRLWAKSRSLLNFGAKQPSQPPDPGLLERALCVRLPPRPWIDQLRSTYTVRPCSSR